MSALSHIDSSWVSLTFLWFALGLSVARELGVLLDDLHGVLLVLGVVVNFNFVHEHLPSEEKLGFFLVHPTAFSLGKTSHLSAQQLPHASCTSLTHELLP